MREIKYRAWIKGANMPYMADWNELSDQESFGWPFGDAGIELMQLTGLKDKNGVDIFEGDIFQMKPFDLLGNFYEVKYEHSGYHLPNSEAMEVVGNIHENPELLEQTS